MGAWWPGARVGRAALLGLGCLLAAPAGAAPPPGIVAAENFYGDVARQVAGPDATVTSVLTNPDQDPHLFAASPSVARAVADARMVVSNGAGYDPWMARLAGAAPGGGRAIIVAADLVHWKQGENPHLWYDPATMPAVARAIAAALDAADPAQRAGTAQRLQAFLDSLRPVAAKVAALRARFAGTPVTATEPVFGDMAAALGLKMRNEGFQRAVMNDTEPGPSEVAAFEADLRQRRVRALIYNSQATGPAAQRLLAIARQAGVPVVAVTETEPPGTTYQAWIVAELDGLGRALEAKEVDAGNGSGGAK